MILRFRLFGFPVGIQPFFFVMAFFIGPRETPQTVILWISAVTVGVLAHEFGHALVARRFGYHPSILLHSFGGQTSYHPGKDFGALRQIMLSAAGPGVGIVIGVAVMAARIGFSTLQQGLMGKFLIYMVWVNLGWGLLNLFPVLPLDGGQIANTLAEAIAGKKGRIFSLVVSLCLTGALGIWAVMRGEIWLSILAVVLSVSNIQALGIGKGKRPDAKPNPLADAMRSYDLARSLARSGSDEEALDWLETAIHSGLSDGRILDADPVWSALRNHPRFVRLRLSLSDQ